MKHLVGIIVALILLSGSAYGTQQEAPFNLGEVMERVAHHPRMDGNQITIDGQVYQASFDGFGAVLTSRDGKYSYRFPIEDGTEPYIRDGGVCYETPDGDIRFKGVRRGLKYKRMIKNPGFRRYLGDMVIGMKGDGDLARPDRLTLPDASGRGVGYRVDKEGLRISQKDLASFAFPLTLDSEFLIDTTIVYMPAPGGQRAPSVAFDGTNCLVVWEALCDDSYDIYGARISQSGIVLDSAGIVISTAANDQRFPSVAFDGTNYLVVWEDCRSGSYADIYVARVAQSGAVLDSFAVSVQSGTQTSLAVAHGIGDRLLITYSGWTTEINGHPANAMRIWGKFYPFTGVEEEPGPRLLPGQFTLEQNYPNPFNPTTTIRYHLSAVGRPRTAVTLKIYNILGQEVKTLVGEEQPAGNYRVLWDGRNDLGEELSSGVYFCRLKVKGQRLKATKTRKMVLNR